MLQVRRQYLLLCPHLSYKNLRAAIAMKFWRQQNSAVVLKHTSFMSQIPLLLALHANVYVKNPLFIKKQK